MLEFTCSNCGKHVQADDSFGGKRVLCPACEAMSAIAAPEHAAQAKIAQPASSGAFAEGLPPLHEGPMPLKRDEVPGLFGRWLPYLIFGGVVLIAVALIIPAVQKTREAAARTQSINNLKQIVITMHSFHDANKRLPYNGTKPAVAGDWDSGSWAFMILPYLEANPNFDGIKRDFPVPVYLCPGRSRPEKCTGVGGPGPWTDYFLNPFLNDPNGIANAPDAKLTMDKIIDGSSNTIFVGHGQIRPDDYGSTDAIPGFTTTIFNGGNPAMCRGNTKIIHARDSGESMPGDWGGPFSLGSLMGMCDGTVRMLPYDIKGGAIVNGRCDGVRPQVPRGDGGHGVGPALLLGDFLTPNGDENVMDADW